MAGFVYILSNPAFPHLIKIGKSERNPLEFRSSELYTTGVPERFSVEYYAMVGNFNFVEAECHRLLDAFRPNKGREFFEYPVPEAISLIRRLCPDLKQEKVFYRTPEEIKQAEEKYRQELEEAARRKKIEEQRRENEEKAWRERKKRVDSERSEFIELELASNGIPETGLYFTCSLISLWLMAIGSDQGGAFPFVAIGVLWVVCITYTRKKKNEAEEKARERFPYEQ